MIACQRSFICRQDEAIRPWRAVNTTRGIRKSIEKWGHNVVRLHSRGGITKGIESRLG